MAATYACPGLPSRAPDGAASHNGACCVSFVALSPAERERRGVRRAGFEHEPRPELAPYEVDVIDVPTLIAIVADLQRRATEKPDELLEPTIAYVEITPEHGYEEVLALIELGRPYGLVAGHRRSATTTGGNPR